MSNLSDMLKRAVAKYAGLSLVEQALADSQQQRSWVMGETGRDPGLPALALEVLRLRGELAEKRKGDLTPKEAERLQRLRDRAYYLQNKIDAHPMRSMHPVKAELSALCWAVEKISGIPFDAQGGIGSSSNSADS